MKRVCHRCLLYAVLTTIFMVVHHWIVTGVISFNFVNGLLFFSGVIPVLFMLVFVKTAAVLLGDRRYCDDQAVLSGCHSWYCFMHYLYNSRISFLFPFSISRIDYSLVDKVFSDAYYGVNAQRQSKTGVYMITDLQGVDDESALQSVANTFQNFAEMVCIGMVSAVVAVASSYCMAAHSAPAVSFLAGTVLAVVAYCLLRFAIVLINASVNVRIGRYAHARIILYCLYPFFPFGTLFAHRSLRVLRDNEVEHRK